MPRVGHVSWRSSGDAFGEVVNLLTNDATEKTKTDDEKTDATRNVEKKKPRWPFVLAAKLDEKSLESNLGYPVQIPGDDARQRRNSQRQWRAARATSTSKNVDERRTAMIMAQSKKFRVFTNSLHEFSDNPARRTKKCRGFGLIKTPTCNFLTFHEWFNGGQNYVQANKRFYRVFNGFSTTIT